MQNKNFIEKNSAKFFGTFEITFQKTTRLSLKSRVARNKTLSLYEKNEDQLKNSNIKLENGRVTKYFKRSKGEKGFESETVLVKIKKKKKDKVYKLCRKLNFNLITRNTDVNQV